ncbi:MAG: phosphate/phosphite/phosphonate ABC transporter substrate-binding protein [Acidimicrobiales bacterium]
MTDPSELSRRRFLQRTGAVVLAGAGALALAACGGRDDESTSPAGGEAATPRVPNLLRFGVGPLLATPGDTKAAYDPFFSWLAGQLGTKHELTAADSWGGISVALGANQLDLAWMGPFGYVLANARTGAQAIATAKYDDKPVYHAIVVGRPELTVNTWPDDAKGRSISFAEASSTSGWLIPTFWFKQRGLDPKSYFKYTEGSSHPANELAVATGQVDFATDYDRNRTAMIESGKLKATDTKVVWTSDPLPNDAIGVRKGFDAQLATRIQDLLVGLTPEQAKEILPNHYTGFIAATNDSYKTIRDAAVSLDALKS